MTSSLKSSLDPATTGPTIGLVLNECLRRRVMSPHEEIEAALDEYQTRSCAATVTGAQAFARLLRLAEERADRSRGALPRCHLQRAGVPAGPV
jgi:hypothetical protein